MSTTTAVMHRRPIRALTILGLATILAMAALLTGSGDRVADVAAFEHTWRLKSCTDAVRPTSSQRGLLDDAPGAGAGNDAAFAYVKADDQLDESCTWYTEPSFSSQSNLQLSVRAAVNDGGRLRVYPYSGERCTGTLLASVIYGSGYDAPADGAFRTVTEKMAVGTVRSVCIFLDDRSNSHAQRVSAIIDRIQISDPQLGSRWQERFSKSG